MFISTDHPTVSRPGVLWRLGAVAVAAVALLVACGDDEGPSPTTIAPAVTVPAATTVAPAVDDGY